jgi:hypothetical protein
VPDSPPTMDNGQLAGLMSAITIVGGALAGAIKWAVGHLSRSQDRYSLALRELADAQAAAAEATTRLDSKVDTLLKLQGVPVAIPETRVVETKRLTTIQRRRRTPAPTERNELDADPGNGDHDEE